MQSIDLCQQWWCYIILSSAPIVSSYWALCRGFIIMILHEQRVKSLHPFILTFFLPNTTTSVCCRCHAEVTEENILGYGLQLHLLYFLNRLFWGNDTIRHQITNCTICWLQRKQNLDFLSNTTKQHSGTLWWVHDDLITCKVPYYN